MQRFKAILGYAWAAAALVVALATFVGNNALSQAIAGTGIVINPRYSGGEVDTAIVRDGYRVVIHRPVFEALVGRPRTGFVQVDWKPDSVAAWFIVSNDGSSGSTLAAIPGELAKTLADHHRHPHSARRRSHPDNHRSGEIHNNPNSDGPGNGQRIVCHQPG